MTVPYTPLNSTVHPAELFNIAIDSIRWANNADHEMLNYWCRRYYPIEDEL